MDIVMGILLGSFISYTNKQLITTKGGYPRPQNVQDPVEDSDSDSEIEHDSYDDIPLLPPGSPTLDPEQHHAVPYDDIPLPPPGPPTLVRSDAAQLQSDAS